MDNKRVHLSDFDLDLHFDDVLYTAGTLFTIETPPNMGHEKSPPDGYGYMDDEVLIEKTMSAQDREVLCFERKVGRDRWQWESAQLCVPTSTLVSTCSTAFEGTRIPPAPREEDTDLQTLPLVTAHCNCFM